MLEIKPLFTQVSLREKIWNNDAFMKEWLSIWPSYNDYVDGETKTTLANLQNQSDKTQGGSDSIEIAGPVRLPHSFATMPTPLKKRLCTHLSNKLCSLIVRRSKKSAILAKQAILIHGANLSDTLKETAPAWALKKLGA